MSEPKTRPTAASAEDFIAALSDDERRADCQTLLRLMQRVTGEAPVMWGPNIIGFGKYRYRYANGKELDWPLAAFSPRKQDLTIYLMPGFESFDALLARLGKHKTGKVCLYLKRLANVDLATLETLVTESVRHTRQRHQ